MAPSPQLVTIYKSILNNVDRGCHLYFLVREKIPTGCDTGSTCKWFYAGYYPPTFMNHMKKRITASAKFIWMREISKVLFVQISWEKRYEVRGVGLLITTIKQLRDINY